MHRRDLLRVGSALWAGLPADTVASSLTTPEDFSTETAKTIEQLKNSAVPPGKLVFLDEAGRSGLFRSMSGPSPIPDPLQGIYVTASSGRSHFARLWDGRVGRPEWFNARSGDGQFDCAPAIEACIALCPVTQLGQADYFIRRTLVLDRSWRTISGSGIFATEPGQGTRIILQGSAPGIHESDLLLVGARAQPSASSAGFVTEIHLANVTLIRDGASAPHRSGDLRRYPVGLRVSFATRCTFARIASLENSVGFYFGGTVYTKVDDCLAQRVNAGSGGSGPDLAAGFLLDGAPRIGLAGGNASLYLDRCLAVGQHASHVRPTGLAAQGAFVDSFIDRFESAQIANGIQAFAHGAGEAGQTVDLHIRNCVLDACSETGLCIDLAGTQTASVEIVDPYVYAAGSGGSGGVVVRDGGGLVTITGGQVHGDFRNGSLLLSHTRGVRVAGLKLHEGSRPVIVTDSGALQLEPQVLNTVRRTDAFAVTCERVYRTALRPLVIGAAGALGGGVALDAACNYCSVDTSAVDPGCFVAVTASRKLWFGGADATHAAATAFTARGNVAIGVLG